MNAQEFVIWIKGFLEASGKGGLETHQVSKTNIYTTTSDNIPFNWQYKDK